MLKFFFFILFVIILFLSFVWGGGRSKSNTPSDHVETSEVESSESFIDTQDKSKNSKNLETIDELEVIEKFDPSINNEEAEQLNKNNSSDVKVVDDVSLNTNKKIGKKSKRRNKK